MENTLSRFPMRTLVAFGNLVIPMYIASIINKRQTSNLPFVSSRMELFKVQIWRGKQTPPHPRRHSSTINFHKSTSSTLPNRPSTHHECSAPNASHPPPKKVQYPQHSHKLLPHVLGWRSRSSHVLAKCLEGRGKQRSMGRSRDREKEEGGDKTLGHLAV